MQYLTIPNTALKVSRLCLGLASIGVKNTENEGKALLDAFLDAGGNFIDTARVYSNWVPGELNRSERIIGDWLTERGVRGRVVVATKGGHPDLVDKIPLLSQDAMEIDLQGSLEKLQTDVIDLYYLHRDDLERPVAEMLDVLHAFQQAGKIRYYACSNWAPVRIREAHVYAQEHGYTGFVANQMRWSVGSFHMRPSADLTMAAMDQATYKLHDALGLAAIPYSSQAGGFFTKLAANASAVEKSGYHTPDNLELYAYLKVVAQDLGVAISYAVLAYFWEHPFLVVPIVGCRSLAQLEDSLQAVDCQLPDEVMQKIHELTDLN